MKQYRHQPGTSSRIYYLLTVKDDGTMELVFHGTDRTLTEEASVNQDGWIVTNGAMYPPLNSGRWQQISDVRNQMEEVRCGENEKQNCNMIQTERTAVCSPTLPETGNETRRGQEPCADDTLSHSCSSPRVSRERRRQPSSAKRQASQDPYSRLYGSPAIAVDHTDDHSDRNRKIIAAVATAAVFIVLVNTIGLFGVAAIGLLAGGLIK